MNQSLITALLALMLFGSGYAALVRYIRKRNPNHGQTAWFVVVGVAVVVITFALLRGVEAALVLGGLFAAAGIPMIAEYVDSHTNMLQRQGMLTNLRGEDDAV